MTMRLPCPRILGCVGVATVAVQVAAQSITPVGMVPGSGASVATSVSDDGEVVFGYVWLPVAGGSPGASAAFRWTPAGGTRLVDLSPLVSSHSAISGCTASGATFVGTFGDSSECRVFLGANGSVTRELILPSASDTWFPAVSADGSAVVLLGTGESGPYRWRDGIGMEDLRERSSGRLLRAWGTSADGSVVVGAGVTEPGAAMEKQAALWSSSDGFRALGMLPGSHSSEAFAASADGTVVVGSSYGADGTAFRWSSAGGMRSLGVPLGCNRSFASAVSADGSTIVGECSCPSSDGYHRDLAIWRPGIGMVRLGAYLSRIGIDASDWSFEGSETISISRSGRFVVGYGLLAGHSTGFIADLGAPCVADLTDDRLVDGADLGEVLSRWGPTNSDPASQMADVSRDGVVDGADLGVLLAEWGPCT